MLRISMMILVCIGMSPASVFAEPIKFKGVRVHSDAERGSEICTCIKSGKRECLYKESSDSDNADELERIMVFAGDKVFSPPFEIGCSVDVVAKGTLAGGNVEHFMGACLSPGGSANFFGYRIVSGDDDGEEVMSITGPSYLVKPVRETQIAPDFDNGTYTTLIMPTICEDVSVAEAQKYFELDD